MVPKIILLLSFLFPLISFSQYEYKTYIADPESVPREHPVDMLTLSLDIAFEPQEGKVSGKVIHTFKTLQQKVDTLFLDAPGIRINSILMDQQPIKFTTQKSGVTLFFPASLKWQQQYSVTIDYEAQPKKGIYFIGWNDAANISRKQIWTQGQATDNRHWIPMYDSPNDKVVSDIKVRFDSQYEVLSNGILETRKKEKDGTTFWHYRMEKPHPTYLIMLGIGEYKIREMKARSGVPIYLYYYPEHEDRVDYMYKYMKEMMDFFEKEIGVPYPWKTYSQIPVQEFMYGAMENTMATVYGDFFCVDRRAYNDRNYVAVNAHELAHQWFGDMVTARSSAHHWLQESFATHYNLTYEKEAFGQEHFDWGRRSAAERAFEASLHDNYGVGHSRGGSSRFYPKGSLVLEMLKYVVGREQFNHAIRYYLQKHAYANVDSEDLLIAFHESLGMSLDWFWEEWIYHGGEPEYKVAYRSLTTSGKTFTEFEIEQVHTVNEAVTLFTMPFIFEVHYTDGTKDAVKEWISEKYSTVRVQNPQNKTIAYVLFDPGSQVLKKVQFSKSLDEWKNQLVKAENILDRYDAAIALRDYPMNDKIAALKDAWKRETFYGVKGEILMQAITSGDQDPETGKIISAGIQDQDVQVRKSAVKYLETLTPEMFPVLAGYFDDPEASYDLLERALELLVSNDPANAAAYFAKGKDLKGIGNSFRIKWLELAVMNDHQKDASEKELIAYTSPSWEFRTRVNALYALKKLNICTRDMIQHIAQASVSANRRMAGPAIDVLEYFNQQAAFREEIRKTLELKDTDPNGAAKLKKTLRIP